MLASAAGGASYSSALTKVAKQATALYDRAKDLVQNRVGGAVRAVDSLGGALPKGNGILKTAFGLLRARRAPGWGPHCWSPLSDEIASFGAPWASRTRPRPRSSGRPGPRPARPSASTCRSFPSSPVPSASATRRCW